MSNLLNTFFKAGKAAMQLWAADEDPHRVRVIRNISPGSDTILRGDHMFVHESRIPSGNRNNNADTSASLSYEVIVRCPSSCFSVFRTTNYQEAYDIFKTYNPIISNLIKQDFSICSTEWLQTVCQTIREDPSQSIAHVVFRLDMRQFMNEPVVLNEIDELNSKLQSPLQLAIKNQNLQALQYLIGVKASKINVDIDGNNIYHFAANTTKEIIENLAEDKSTMNLLNKHNGVGCTPLHIACLNDKPECVKALLCVGADINVTGSLDDVLPIYTALQTTSVKCVKEIIEMYPKQLYTKDMKNGGTPLHWATSKDIIEALADSGCHLDAKNFEGKTALHIMIQRERLDCAVALIVRHASLSIAENETGNTPLHSAALVGNVLLVKALLVFNANVEALNNEGLTPWGLAIKKCQNASMLESLSKNRIGVLYALHAVGASQNFTSIPDSVRKNYESEFFKIAASSTSKQQRSRSLFDAFLASVAEAQKADDKFCSKGRLLSLDGGGIKGLVLTTALKYMEKEFRTPIVHCFDWIAGTSTGGILALAIASGKTVDECQRLYFKLKDKVFGGENSRPYNAAPFEDLLQTEFGKHNIMSQLNSTPKVLVTATLADRCPPDLMLFRNYKSPQDRVKIPDFENPDTSPLPRPNTRLIWKAARASGAAPSFFRPEECFVDGGILSNNPSLDLLTEISEHNVACRFLNDTAGLCVPRVLVSLGTGVPPVKKTKVVDIFRPNNATETFKLFLGWDGMGKLMLDSILDTDGRSVDRTRSWCLSAGIAFHRFSPILMEDVELDTTDDKTLVELMWTTLSYCFSKKDEIRSLAPLLVDGWKS